MASNYRASYHGISEMLNSAFMQAEMHARAERVAAQAEATAPFYPADPDGKHYKDDFHVESGSRGGAHHDRAYGRVTNDNSAAAIVEYGMVLKDGTVRVPQHATLRKALDAAAG